MNEVTTLILTRDDLVRWAKETVSLIENRNLVAQEIENKWKK